MNFKNILSEDRCKSVKIATDNDLFNQIGRELFFGLVDFQKLADFVVCKDSPFIVVKELAKRLFDVKVEHQQFWLTSPLRSLTPAEQEETVEALCNKFQISDIKLFLEPPPRQVLSEPPPSRENKTLLFFKSYKPEKKDLKEICTYVGRMVGKDIDRPKKIMRKLNNMLGFDPHQVIELYKEINLGSTYKCEAVDIMSSKLVNGDIIWVQKSPSGYSHLLRYPNVPSFFHYLQNREVVHFRFRENPDEDILLLELSKKDTYVQVVYKVAKKLGIKDASRIWLTAHHCNCPVDTPIQFRQRLELLEMLVPYDEKSDILYIEEKENSLPGWSSLRTLQVAFLTANPGDEVAVHHISMPKESTVADVLDEIKEKVGLSHPTVGLRFLKVFRNKICKIYSASEKIESITDQNCTLRAEEVPEQEKELGRQDHLITVCHLKSETGDNQVLDQNVWQPFLLVINECETLAHVKIRIQMKLRVQAEETLEWKFACVTTGDSVRMYLNNADILWYEFQAASGEDLHLGLMHP